MQQSGLPAKLSILLNFFAITDSYVVSKLLHLMHNFEGSLSFGLRKLK